MPVDCYQKEQANGSEIDTFKVRVWGPNSKCMWCWADLCLNGITLSQLSSKLGSKIVMNTTGIQDKTGADIYEGDILDCTSKYGGSFRTEVVFKDGCFEVTPDQWGSVHAGKLLKVYAGDELRVVGNIYENPELLTKASAHK